MLKCSNCMKDLELDRIKRDCNGNLISYPAYCSDCSRIIHIRILFSPDNYMIKIIENNDPNTYDKIITFIFDSLTLSDFEQFKKSGRICLENGYLARKLNGQITYFHRFLMNSKIIKLPPNQRLTWHVHRINGNPHYNTIDNLVLLSPEEHKKRHEGTKFYNLNNSQLDYELNTYYKSFETWCIKVHGYVDETYWEEFDSWIKNRQ